ncbi:MAG: cysteine desulfurase [Prevotellaceae bacterium]|jgi:cysteine desulfurase/selenocysteine lyase|nr:cysteine desulfurase [Prevotellaceae bacterium]
MLTQDDIQLLRKDFPILDEQIYGRRLVYLDNAATTQKPVCVVDTIKHQYFHTNANVHRGVHFLSHKATELHEAARKTVADFIGVPDEKGIIFTRGTTEAINLVASSFGEAFCNRGDQIIVSAMEHHSNIVPWQLLAERKDLKIKVIPISEKGELDLDFFRTVLNEKTKIVAVSHVSNVLGTVNNVREIIRMAHEKGVAVLVDGAQAVPHIPLNISELDADFYVFSAHKIYGPTGIGVLFGKTELLEKMPPYQGGGEMIAKVTFERTTYNELPFKFEAGTPDYIGSTAFATALKYVQNIGIKQIAAYENELLQYASTAMLRNIDKLKIYGTASEKSAVLSFNIGTIHPYDIGVLLDHQGIAVRTGHHCAQPLMDFYEIQGTVRASFAFYNTLNEIDIFVEAVKKAVKMLS